MIKNQKMKCILGTIQKKINNEILSFGLLHIGLLYWRLEMLGFNTT